MLIHVAGPQVLVNPLAQLRHLPAREPVLPHRAPKHSRITCDALVGSSDMDGRVQAGNARSADFEPAQSVWIEATGVRIAADMRQPAGQAVWEPTLRRADSE